jgi:hypothetical protein
VDRALRSLVPPSIRNFGNEQFTRLRAADGLDLHPNSSRSFLKALPLCKAKGALMMRKWLIVAAAAVALTAMPAFAADVKIDDLVVANTIPAVQRDTEPKAAKAFYQFWNTGDKSLLKAAISPYFIDHTLPPDRPQGPQSPAFASSLTAMPENTSDSVLCSGSPRTMAITPEVAGSPPSGTEKPTVTTGSAVVT